MQNEYESTMAFDTATFRLRQDTGILVNVGAVALAKKSESLARCLDICRRTRYIGDLEIVDVIS